MKDMKIKLNPDKMVLIKNKDNSISIVIKQDGFTIEIANYKSEDIDYTLHQTKEILSYIQKKL